MTGNDYDCYNTQCFESGSHVKNKVVRSKGTCQVNLNSNNLLQLTFSGGDQQENLVWEVLGILALVNEPLGKRSISYFESM